MTGNRFETLLVANRGEIARRVMRTARSMGLRTVAVFVDADTNAPHVTEADQAIRITSYLDGPSLIDRAVALGVDAIHPGYGFLSENADFAAAVEDAGLSWIGPGPDAIRAMGDKIEAKRLAEAAGVPILPSAEAQKDFPSIGFPLLIKAAAGGGGKGMRVVETEAELADGVAAARREALSGFGDDRVFAERYVPRARHIEIQIMGDRHGNLVHLGERECSVQRRHQKIIEESPSPFVSEALRKKMGKAALRLGAELSYRSAGTVEFLVDDTTGEFFFLEVNTRLQVEHPVTEEVTGRDLVRDQLRVAMGERLGYDQADVSFSGHAIEARLYAEDPGNDFLPATGTINGFEPAAEPSLRWDAGVEPGSVIGVDFDPMIAKVIAHGPNRADAAGRLALGLERLHIGGVVTNRDFLTGLLRNDAFLSGDTTTDFIDRIQVAAPEPSDADLELMAVAAALWQQGANRADAEVLTSIPSGFVVGRLPPERIDLVIDNRPLSLHYRSRRDGSFRIGPRSEGPVALVHRWSPSEIDVEVDGRRSVLRVTAGEGSFLVTGGGLAAELTVVPRFAVPEPDVPGGAVAAPMPGKVLEIRVAVGDTVTAGQVVAVLEAMKMENHLAVAHDGVVSEVRVSVGDQVDKDMLLLVVTAEDADESNV